MFAPHCPTCRTRVLLGTDRIVGFAGNATGDRVVVLRCTCGALVDWDQAPPRARTVVAMADDAWPLGA